MSILPFPSGQFITDEYLFFAGIAISSFTGLLLISPDYKSYSYSLADGQAEERALNSYDNVIRQ